MTHKSNNRNNVSAISLFSGAGGLDIGAHRAGVKIRAALDNDPDSIATLRANRQFKGTEIFQNDLSEFNPGVFRDILDGCSPDLSLVIGGPPCQPFSKNGYWVTNKKRLKHADPRNLIAQYFRAVASVEPDAFILENVESLLHPTNRVAVQAIRDEAKLLGYNVTIYRLNAADFGVPQKRKRVFVVGTKFPIDECGPTPTYRDRASEDMFDNLPPHRGVQEFIAPFSGSEYFEQQEVAQDGTYYPDLCEVPPGRNYIALTKRSDELATKFRAGQRFWNFLLKLHPDLPSWTIPAQPGPWVGPFHWDNRRLRIPEIAAIQTFPKTYKFRGSRRSVQRQIGNAVPAELARVVVAHVVRAARGEQKKSGQRQAGRGDR